MAAATESQVFISRFKEMDAAAPERLIRVRGRHSADLEMVLRFRPATLDYEHVIEGGAATLYRCWNRSDSNSEGSRSARNR